MNPLNFETMKEGDDLPQMRFPLQQRLKECSHGIPIRRCQSAHAFTPARQRVSTILPVKVPFCIRSKASIALFIGKTWPT